VAADVKAKRRALTAKTSGARTARTPTVRRFKSAITPVRPKAPGHRVDPSSSSPPNDAAVDVLGGRPVSLEVDLGRGLVLENPVLVASGPFGYGVEVADAVDMARLGGIVTRSTTLRPRSGHAAPRMADVPAGVLQGMGLQNPGIETVLDRYAPTWAKWPVPVIVSLAGESASDVADAARRLEGVPGVSGIEVNLSVPNMSRGGSSFGLDADGAASLVRAVRRATDLPLIAKLTASAADVRAVAKAVEEAGADAISAINTLPGLALAADRTGPALGSGYGGLSGPALRPIALRVVFEIAQSVDIPVIGIGGITTIDDVLDFLAVGASAVGVGIAALADPMLPVRLADELADACRARGLPSVEALVGTALPKRSSSPSTRGAEYAR
jgi:dihydroorotate dehydrogenase (NAD+) catalytic subunit